MTPSQFCLLVYGVDPLRHHDSNRPFDSRGANYRRRRGHECAGDSLHAQRTVTQPQIVGSLLYTEFVFAKIDSWKQGKTAHVEPVPPPL